MPSRKMRLERDSMGELEVPAKAYYGGNTRRAELNFPISNLRLGRSFIKAIGQIKQAAAFVNLDLGAIEPDIAQAIIDSSQRVIEGEFDDQFVVDVFQTGSGTSTNMNANEVISNVAIESLGGTLGSRTPVHPNDHVNKGQSSNDVFPSTIHLAAAGAIKDDLMPALQELEDSLRTKSQEFWEIVKTGRTHLQDATPIRLGQEFLGYAGQLELGRKRAEKALAELSVLALGGTAVGTGIGMHPQFSRRVINRLAELTGLDLSETTNHFQAQSTLDAVVSASGELKSIAVGMLKIANDLRWLGSGPRAGIGEIMLPEVQPGSSIMPGKVNPVIPESVTMVSAQVIGNDTTIAIAGQSGNFELNVMMPVAAHNILESIELLATSAKNLARQCINGLTATDKGPEMVMEGLAICTALAPIIGYDAAASIAHEASKNGETIKEVAMRVTDLNSTQLDEILEPLSMTEPNE
ncbi:MAG: class II fumarate hydratase [SAR202 cluster bacterium]|nr:MAG: class II fumarate hydratase [SAR202 cluster bacterium]KAA1300721.1 MAG: class II fumarate hydratase [SAR202 cluster bacterium]MCH2529975.1 class II fumarate hydratase [Dehalococcoidia bacterium]MQG90224.1 class II fumarate hydratase [SAR202 cluster bacterium]GIT58256.1 MAG: fumarate hydratase class II [Dehalococcoidia bacterium]|tara:strand:+ start:3860 stop:5257 length:1398 start_codon:yes stop_codon:yes gene_type:complete